MSIPPLIAEIEHAEPREDDLWLDAQEQLWREQWEELQRQEAEEREQEYWKPRHKPHCLDVPSDPFDFAGY